jgi:hypothetical protein
MLITTRELTKLPFDTVLMHQEYPVYLYCVTEQKDGGYYVQLEYADASAGRYGVEVDAQDVNEPIWDYEEDDH